MSGTRKTVSMSKNTISELLRAIAQMIEEDKISSSELLDKIKTSSKDSVELKWLFDKNTSENAAKQILENMSIESLISLVNQYTLDPKQTVRKWKDKTKIIDFILDKRKSLLSRYEGF